MDELESDSGLHIFSSPESRALNISQLWIRHAERLRPTSPKASIAAYLRAAHTALFALDSDACNDAFNESCAELRTVYESALARVVRSFSDHSWEQVDLSPTRYRLVLTGDHGPVDLAQWETIRESTTPSSPGHRPGVGSEAVGCRTQPSLSPNGTGLGICTPLTFVVSFDTPPSSDLITATLVAYDASQRSVVPLGHREVTLAADFGLALQLISERALDTRKSRFLCVGSPAGGVETVIALAPSAASSWLTPLGLPLLTDPGTSEHVDLCLFTLDSSASPDINARALAASTGFLLADSARNSLTPKVADLFLVPADPEATFVTAAFLGRLKRATRAHPHRAAKTAIRVRGIYVMTPGAPSNISAEAADRLSARASALQVPLYKPASAAEPMSLAEQSGDIRSKVAETLVDDEPKSSQPTAGSLGTTLELSPIY